MDSTRAKPDLKKQPDFLVIVRPTPLRKGPEGEPLGVGRGEGTWEDVLLARLMAFFDIKVNFH